MPVKRINLLNALHLVSVFGSAKYLLRCLVLILMSQAMRTVIIQVQKMGKIWMV